MKRKKLAHGTRGRYKYRGCRCERCRHANGTYMREYWRRRRATDQQADPGGARRFCKHANQ